MCITVYENMGLIKAVNANIQTENVTIASSQYLRKININATIEQCDLSSIKQKSWITTFYMISFSLNIIIIMLIVSNYYFYCPPVY